MFLGSFIVGVRLARFDVAVGDEFAKLEGTDRRIAEGIVSEHESFRNMRPIVYALFWGPTPKYVAAKRYLESRD